MGENPTIKSIRGINLFVCNVCGKEFETREQFGGHVSGHSRLGKSRKEKVSTADRVYGYCVNCGEPLYYRGRKYCSKKCQQEYQAKEWENKWLNGELEDYKGYDSWGAISDRIRNYLFKKYNNRCAQCGWGEINPYTKKIPLEVEHIDGDYKNNSPENLTLLCPNCHSLTSTYRGANRGRGRKKTWKMIEYTPVTQRSE